MWGEVSGARITYRSFWVVLFLAFSLPAQSDTGPVAWWKFDEGSGTTAADASGSGNTSTLVSPSWTSGKIGSGALTFGGTKLGTVSGSGSLANLYVTGLTVSAWIKPTSSTGGRIIDKDNNDVGWFFGTTNAGQINFTSDQDTTGVTALTSSTSIALNTWQHVLMTWDGTAGSAHVHLYINGVNADGTGTSGTGPEQTDSATPLSIGNRQVDSARPFTGSIDDVRIYNRVLSTTEIQALADATVPGAPSGLTATAVSGAQINLSWTAATDNLGVTGYLVERCQGASCTTFAQIATPTATSYSDTGLTASTSYSYRVRATDAAGNLSTYSSTASATTSAGGGDTQAPTAPSSLTATAASSSAINLSWTASTDNVGVTGYSIQRCQGSTCTTLSPSGTATNYSDTGLSASTTYTYQIRATDAAGNWGNYSTAVTATTSAGGTTDTTAPSAPVLLSATGVSSTQINLGWSASTDNVGVTGYQVESCAGPGCSNFAPLGSAVTTTSYNVTGLTAGAIYNFRVKASDAAGNVSTSNVLSATTPTASGSSSTVVYDYDALGRLVQTEMSSLSAVQAYAYDPAGNITSSVAAPITSLTLGGISAQQGAAGSQITIYGSGFSTTAASNAVTIGGTAATVVSATATRLVVSVPAGASTGNISITTGGTTVTSTRPFNLTAASAAPTLVSFSPTIAVVGAAVTVAGSNFDPVLARNKVLLNGIALPVTAVTPTTLNVQIPPNVASGHLQVVTPRGTAQSSGYLVIPPSPYTAANVGSSGSVTENGAAATLSFANTSQVLLGFFNGQQGEKFVRVMSSMAAGSTSVQIYAPNGQSIAAISSGQFIDLPALPRSGTYTIAATNPTSASNFTFSVAKADVQVMNTMWQQNSNYTLINSIIGQVHRWTFTGIQGETLGMLFNPQNGGAPTSNAPGYPIFRVIDKNGAVVWQTAIASNAAGLVLSTPLPSSGTFSLVIDPGYGGSGGYNFWAGSAVNLAMDGSPGMLYVVANQASANTYARLFFQGTAGQALTLHTTHDPAYSGFTPSGISASLTQGLYTYATYIWHDTVTPDASFQFKQIPATDTYFFDFVQGNPGVFDVQLLSAPSAAVTMNGSASLSIGKVGQIGKFTFSGVAGTYTSVELSPAGSGTLLNVDYGIDGPNTAAVPDVPGWRTQDLLNNGAVTNVLKLTQTGQYTVWVIPDTGDVVRPNNSNPSATSTTDPRSIVPGSVTLTVSSALSGTIAVNGSVVPVSSTVVGQSVRLSVSGTATHSLSMKVINSGSCRAAIEFQNAAQAGYASAEQYLQASSNGRGFFPGANTTTTYSLPVTTVTAPYLLEVEPFAGCALNLSLQLTGN